MVLQKLLSLIGHYGYRKTSKRRKIMMTRPEIPDNVLQNILSRLPGKPLTRFRCVSKHWNSLISDPYFIKSRPPRLMILFSSSSLHLHVLDDKTACSKLPSPFAPKDKSYSNILAIGTFNGTVVLALTTVFYCELILYNPSTRACKMLPDPPKRCKNSFDVFGFGHGKTRPDDLKIILGRMPCECHSYRFTCDVFSLTTGKWTTSNDTFRGVIFRDNVGVFLNGFLHWIRWRGSEYVIVVLDVEEMVVSTMDIPCQSDYQSYVLGRLHGHLCMVEGWNNGFVLWEHGVDNDGWSKTCSFTLGLKGHGINRHSIVCILEDGRVIVQGRWNNQIVICDPFKGSSKNVFMCYDILCQITNGIAYVENVF